MAYRVVSNVICADFFTIMISVEGIVYSFGSHENGAHGKPEENSLLERIPSLINIKSKHEHYEYEQRRNAGKTRRRNMYTMFLNNLHQLHIDNVCSPNPRRKS